MDDLAARLRAGIAASGPVDDEPGPVQRFAQPAPVAVTSSARQAGGPEEIGPRSSAAVVAVVDRLFDVVGLEVASMAQPSALVLTTASGPVEVGFGGRLTVGRNPGRPGLPVGRSDVSKNHLRIEHDEDGSWTVTDLDSTNGTTLERNGERFRLPGHQPVVLSDGDVLEVPSGTVHSHVSFRP